LKVVLAGRIGFCFGVKRAVRMAEAELGKKRRICSLGSIIHNRQVVDDLSAKGLRVARDLAHVGGSAAVIISSHGTSPRTKAAIAAKGLGIIDTTCPFVLRAQRIASSLSTRGYKAVIVGDSAHPEVRALVGFAPRGASVVAGPAEASRLGVRRGARIAVLSQTTQSKEKFLGVLAEMAAKRPRELKAFDTICNDALIRQKVAGDLAARVDAMLVIGGRNSANTRRLYEVCRKANRNSHLIETEKDLKAVWFRRVRRVGIASGASTPDWMVKKVAEQVKSKD
jgi:4-hydroxy-3-methylbut-2-enyl diphosphate reductase